MKPLQSPGLRRAGALVVATAITSTTLLSAATPAQAHPAGDRAVSAGADWLTGQLTDGIVVGQFDTFFYDDFGLSADIAFALDAVGGRDATVTKIVDAIEPDADAWVTDGTPDRVYAGSVAKMVSVVQAAGQDPEAYHGMDQVDRLEGLVSSAPPVTGRLQDAGVDPSSQFDADFVNVIGQSFAARALLTAGSSRAAEATSFLLEQQCNEGFFRATLTVDKTSPTQGCVSGIDKGSVDTTALTVINILDTPGVSTRAKGAAALAASWLKTQQAPDGSFSAGGPEGFNANSTGLAGWALAKAGDTASAVKAATWLRGVQIADLAPCSSTLAAENGAVAFKAEALTASRSAGGISVPQRDQYRRASAQALPALASVPESGAPAVSAPATAVENTTVTVTVTGLGAAEPACVSLGGQAKQVTGTGGALSVTFQLPAGVATHTFRLTTLGGSTTAATTATATPTVPQVGVLETQRVVTVRRHRFAVSVSCEGDAACAGTLKVRTAREVAFRSGKRVVTIAKREYSVPAGAEKRLVLKLTKAGRVVLADGKVKVKAVQKAPGARRAVTTFWLKPARG